MHQLTGRVAIVTGGASGIGEATARLMSANGATVLIADIQDEQGRALAESIGTSAEYVRCDVTSEQDVARVVDWAVDAHGRLDCMFNNAGIRGVSGPIDELATDELDKTMALLLRSVFLGAKHAARVMKPARSGVILSTASTAGIMGGYGPHAYTAAKHAIIGLTKNLAAELGTYGIRVNAIAPGGTVTPLAAFNAVGDANDLDGMAALLQDRTPLAGRIGLAEDVAEAALWLASEAAGYVSGHTLVVDAGRTTGSMPHGQPLNI